MTVEIYSKPHCGYCASAKSLLNSKGITFTEYTVGVDASKDDIQERIKNMGLSNQVRTVPQIFYTDKNGKTTYIGGFTELQAQQDILGT